MGKTKTYENMGITVTYPDEFDNAIGALSEMPMGSRNGELYVMMFSYLALTKEEVEEKTRQVESTPDGMPDAEVMNALGMMLMLVGINEKRGPAEIIDMMKTDTMKEEMFTEVGGMDDIRYFAVYDPESEKKGYLERQRPEFVEEFLALRVSLIEALKKAKYFTPTIPGADLVGKTLHFETKDIDGNPVKSEDLFAAHAVTMLNCWATWCAPCKSELEELGNIDRRLAEKDAAVVGLCFDADEKPDECRKLIAEKNMGYLNILPYEGIDDELPVSSIPVTFFVGREGKILYIPLIGVPTDISQYETIIDKLLNALKEGFDPSPAAADQEEKKDGYRVVVCDEEGSPVKDVKVRFCSDTSCLMGKTDENGVAAFDTEEGSYTVHVMKVPEGYQADDQEYAVPETYGDTAITLKKA